MLFKVGIETPKDNETAYGLVIPALCGSGYTTVSAADSLEGIVPMAREAALTMMEEMATDGQLDLVAIAEANRQDFRNDPDYADYDDWAFIDIDLDGVMGRQKRINVSLSDFLIARIDERVKVDNRYSDRSDFLSKAAFVELVQSRQP